MFSSPAKSVSPTKSVWDSPTKSFSGAGGMLVSDDCYTNKKGVPAWSTAARRLSVVHMLIGLGIVFISLLYTYEFTESNGVLLGLVLMCGGLLGLRGARHATQSPLLVNAQLIACIVGIFLAFQWISEVVRDSQVDCALAELYQRGSGTEEKLASFRQTEMMNAVFNRLNEMDDMLHLVQEGASKSIELRQEQQKLAVTDLNYIRSKIDMVQRHAQDVLNSVLKNPEVNADSINNMGEEGKALLRKRLDTADKVIDRIQKMHEGDTPLTAEEYQELLEALTDVSIVPDKSTNRELLQAKREVPHMKAALVRQENNNYHNLAVGTAYEDLKKITARREERRQRFRDQFNDMLDTMASSYGKDYVADLPEHCIKETRGEKMAVLAGFSSIGLQLVSAFVSLTLSQKLPHKTD